MSKRKTISWWKEELGISTKSELNEKIRSIIKSAKTNVPIDQSNTEFIVKILKHHHHFKEKIGAGMKHLVIRENQSYGATTLGIWIIRVDDTETDISWVAALKPDGKASTKEDVSSAARYEIKQQIHDFHNNNTCATICELCKQDMTTGVGIHADHINPFEQLFLEFLSSLHLTYFDVNTKDLGIDSCFLDRDLAAKWFQFHKEKATLRLVHGRCNLKRKI